MRRTRRSSRTTGCVSLLTIVVFPLTIYFVPQMGERNLSLAAYVTGILVMLKVVIEWGNRSHSHHRHHAPVYRYSVPRPCLVSVQAPLAGCYLCQHIHYLRPYHTASGQRVGLCQRCYDYAMDAQTYSMV